jgi:hypothetical protein
MKKMMIVLVVLIMILLINVPCWGEEINQREWNFLDSTLLITRIIDLGQTLDIKNHPELCEGNPLLGKHPSDQQIYEYFIGLLILDYLNYKYSPDWLYKLWINIELRGELYCIGGNIKIGLKINI